MPTRLVLDDTSTTYLVLEEPISGEEQDGADGAVLIADRTGRLMKDCRARFFEASASSDDRTPRAELPIIAENVDALICIIERAGREGIKTSTQARWGDPNDLKEEMLIPDR